MAGVLPAKRSKSDCSTIARLTSAGIGLPWGSVVVTATSTLVARAKRIGGGNFLGLAIGAFSLDGELHPQVTLDVHGAAGLVEAHGGSFLLSTDR